MQKIGLIGLGPHAMRIYYPYLEQLISLHAGFSLELVIDTEGNREKVESFLKLQKLQPKTIIFLKSPKQITPKSIDPEAYRALVDKNITKAIISTEPKAHKVYLKACIELGIPVVVDKPITSPLGLTPPKSKTLVARSGNAGKKIYKDVLELQSLIDKNPKARVLVQCQRRNHPGYNTVMDTVSEIVKTYGIPITYIQIHHSDGMWNMPDEFIYRENHPYKYGYGKLMHSGYHFIDLLTTLEKINLTLEDKLPDNVNIFSQSLRPSDQHTIIAPSQYAQFFGEEVAKKLQPSMSPGQLQRYGEIDSYSQIQFTKEGRVITTAQLSLMQSGFSQRAWTELPNDSYKSNGRIRHEFINIHIGPLCSIQVHSYQSTEASDKTKRPYGPGNNEHFDIYIFRNSNLIGGKAFELIEFGSQESKKYAKDKKYLGHNEIARHKTLDELMFDMESNSELKQHIETNKLLAAIHKNHIKQHYGTIPYSKFKITDIF